MRRSPHMMKNGETYGIVISPSQRSPTEPRIKPGRLPPVGVSSLFLLWQRHTIWRLCICWHCCRMCGHGNGRYRRKCLKSTLKMAELCLMVAFILAHHLFNSWSYNNVGTGKKHTTFYHEWKCCILTICIKVLHLYFKHVKMLKQQQQRKKRQTNKGKQNNDNYQ